MTSARVNSFQVGVPKLGRDKAYQNKKMESIPGSDGLPAEFCKASFRITGHVYLDIVNKALISGIVIISRTKNTRHSADYSILNRDR